MLYQGIHLFNLKYLLDELVILVCLSTSGAATTKFKLNAQKN